MKKQRFLFFIFFTLALISSCAKRQQVKQSFTFKISALLPATSLQGGSYVRAISSTTNDLVQLDASNSANFPLGVWEFQTVSFQGPIPFAGKKYCGSVKDININGTSQDVNLNISEANCLIEPFLSLIADVGNKFGSKVFAVNAVQFINNQLVITGAQLDKVTAVNISGMSFIENFSIESKSPTQIIANSLKPVSFDVSKIFNLILSDAQAAVASFNIDFSLCNASLNGKGFDCAITANDKDVLSFDAASNKWIPRNVNGLNYKGTFDASPTLDPGGSPSAGDYYIISVAGTINTISYAIGDWIVLSSDGITWEKVGNAMGVTSVFGRAGIVAAKKGDYVLTKMGDVDLTSTTPISGNVLQFNGTNWVPGIVSGGSGNGTVTTVSGTAPISVATGNSTPVITITQANGTANGYLSSSDWNTFNGKQTNITAGAGGLLDYYRGDKTFQTLNTTVVLEGTNQYFTNARVLGLALAGFDNTLTGQIAGTDNLVQAFGKTQKQINSLSAGGSGYVSTAGGSILAGTTTLSGVIDVTGTGSIHVGTPIDGTSAVNKAYVDSAVSSAVSSQTPSEYSPSCPTGYVSVPAIAYYPGPSFCVMKWEAKTGSSTVAATTAVLGTPVASINRDNARASCRLIGAGYDLISNAQWQTIARNIADQATNWSIKMVYSGELSRGHSNNVPPNSLAASADNDGCYGTGQICSDVSWDSQRRTHTLSNGEVVWDIAGNVYEWVSDNSVTAAVADTFISTMSAGDKRQVRYGNDQFCATSSSTPYCGMGYGYVNYSAGAVLRGGYWYDGVGAGVFAANLGNAPSYVAANLGFRCVFVP